MSFVDSENNKAYVITYKELIFTFVVFVMILVVLYPKDLLKEQILSEKSNYDLSMLYLKNLLRHSPEDESLMLILAEQSLNSGKTDLSLRLLGLLLKSEDPEIRKKATLLSYKLEKENYYYLESVEAKRKQKKILRKLFISIFRDKMYDEKSIEKWYKESLFVNVPIATHYFLPRMLQEKPKDIDLLKSGYYLELKLNHPQHAIFYLQRLQKYDTQHRDKWIDDEYYTYMNFREYTKAEKLLQKYAKDSSVWKNRLAEFYLMRKKFRKAASLYDELFASSSEYRVKRKYFYKAVKALQSGNLLEEAVAKVHARENYYLTDRDARSFILKLYIAAGRLDYAESLSKRILYKELH